MYGTTTPYDGVELADTSVPEGLDSGIANYDYGFNPMQTDGEEDLEEASNLVPHKKRARRWSVFEKLESRHYCRVRSCADCWRILNCKCLFATAMLGTFVFLAVTFAHVLFFATEVSSMRFDYIIIGASPAGLLVAHDLVENGAKVLVIEAGNATQYEIGGKDFFAGPISRFDVPFLWPSLSTYPDYKWEGYESSHVTLAKAVGGAGVAGPMTYLRALRTDIDSWRLKNTTWPRIFEAYKLLEWYNDENTPSFHGKSGPIATSPGRNSVLGNLFQEATIASGIANASKDFNDPKEDRKNKVGSYQTNIWRGIRDSAALRFLKPILASENLVLVTNARATRVLLRDHEKVDGSDDDDDDDDDDQKEEVSPRSVKKRAIGVEFLQNGELRTAYLRIALLPSKLQRQLNDYPRGVMLSGGSINNVQMLINSGIGPKDQEEYSVAKGDDFLNLEGVGRNLQDHPVLGLLAAVDPGLADVLSPQGIELFDELPSYISSVEKSRALWAARTKNRTSYWSEHSAETNVGSLGNAVLTTGAFLTSPHADGSGPDIQINVYPSAIEPFKSMFFDSLKHSEVSISADGSVSTDSNLEDDIKASRPLILVTVTLLEVEAKQRVILDNEHPFHAPYLVRDSMDSDKLYVQNRQENSEKRENQKFARKNGIGDLTHLDVARLTWGLKQVRDIFQQDPIKRWVQDEVSPGPEIHSPASMEAWVRENAIPSNHWSGTCKMGPPEDPLAVVNENFEVYSVQDLRVVDASIMPTIVRGDTGATELALAKQASSAILTNGEQDSG